MSNVLYSHLPTQVKTTYSRMCLEADERKKKKKIIASINLIISDKTKGQTGRNLHF